MPPAFAVVVLLAIWRYLTTLLLTYMIFLFSSVGAVFLIYIQGFPFLPVVSLAVLSAVGLYPPILILIPLAIQRADTLENAVLDRGARELWQGAERRAAAKLAKPRDPRKKHLAKFRRLMKGKLPTILDLSHNGVLERAGVVRWCFAASDGRPVLPFTTNLLVARGSFLYLFSLRASYSRRPPPSRPSASSAPTCRLSLSTSMRGCRSSST